MAKITLVSTQLAPFQLELAAAVNDVAPESEYHVIFTQTENRRPAHWLDLSGKIEKFATIAPPSLPPERVSAWTQERLAALSPDTVLIGGVRGTPSEAAFAFRSRYKADVRLGFWMEPPLRNPRPLHRLLRRVDYFRRLRRADFVLAIGDRAHAYYRAGNGNTHFVPYGSDLSVCLERPLPKERGPRTKFLFSGGLHERHNFPEIMRAFEGLLERRGPCFEFIVSGYGPEQAHIDAAIRRTPALGELIRYERQFERWPERLSPFLESHVFVYPTQHAGWGLVIPEAMAAGLAVVSSDAAEASRYLVEHGRTGYFVAQRTESILERFLRCVDDRDEVERVGIAAREVARRCHAPEVARQLVMAIRVAEGPRPSAPAV